jgi:hypothetical protein
LQGEDQDARTSRNNKDYDDNASLFIGGNDRSPSRAYSTTPLETMTMRRGGT